MSASSASTDTSATPSWRGFAGRHRASLVVGLGVVAALAVVVLLGGGAQTGTPLDPDNPGPDGTQALARVLDDQGVDVTVARDANALEATDVTVDTTVVVTSTELLGETTARRLLAHTRGAGLVLVDPQPGLVDTIGRSEPPTRVTLDDGRDAQCSDPLFADLTVEVDRALAYPGDGCFPGEDGSLVVERRDVVLFGLSEALANDQILRADNAAVAVRLLGQRDRLVWYVPTIDDLPAGDGVSLETLLPRWIAPGLWLGAIAVIALVVWRARRLGPLATEPLPVVVKAIETTRARGRLYRKANDRPHAAEALRLATRTRVAARLRLAGPTDVALVREVSRHTGRDEAEVSALLDPGEPPGSDHDLITLARGLAELDREVRRT
jgi:Domain of unknown function (DUF4350)